MASIIDIDASKARFEAHASITDDEGRKFLSVDDFVGAIAPPNEDYRKISRNSYAVLFNVADQSKKGLVSMDDWLLFDQLLEMPDAEYRIAFRVFNQSKSGFVDFKEFVATYNANKSADALPFDWNGVWAKLYLGESRQRHSMSYNQFSQMLRGLVGERIRQAFQYYDKKNTGFITPQEFEHIMRSTVGHKLSDNLLGSLQSIVNRPSSSSPLVSYATVRAFLNIINNVELTELVARRASGGNAEAVFSRKEFMDAAAELAKFNTFTPLEVDLLFHFAQADTVQHSSVETLARMFDPSWQDPLSRYQRSKIRKADAAKNASSDPKSFLTEVFVNIYNFALGSVAGALGATVVYPIDLVKTRMQNQRKTTPGQTLMYQNSIDCFKKVISREGFKGLYSGLGPQLVGVAPEKAIKLTVNDLVRGHLTNDDGEIPLWAEIVAGGMAGGCQVIFTNPLEIVKIRLQVQGELARAEGIPRRSAMFIVKQLGLIGLYKGASACLLRDVPFSAIYFPTYAHLKRDTFGEKDGHQLKIWELLTAGAIAGIPAAYLTTPADVIKTRLQVEARPGVKAYHGMVDAAKNILKDEGFSAFFKGGPARIFRSSPQFGTTLAAYEVLKRLLPLPGTENTEAGHSVPSSNSSEVPPVRYLRSRNSLKLLLDIDENFGKPFVAAGLRT